MNKIMTHKTKSKNMIARILKREVETINTYEKMWKIKTNIKKYIINR